MRWPGDEGEHLADPIAGGGDSNGYRLLNGQHDTYPDRDTVPNHVAFAALADLIDGRESSPAHHWVVDRAEDATDWR